MLALIVGTISALVELLKKPDASLEDLHQVLLDQTRAVKDAMAIKKFGTED